MQDLLKGIYCKSLFLLIYLCFCKSFIPYTKIYCQGFKFYSIFRSIHIYVKIKYKVLTNKKCFAVNELNQCQQKILFPHLACALFHMFYIVYAPVHAVVDVLLQISESSAHKVSLTHRADGALVIKHDNSLHGKLKGQITISSDPSPLVGIQFFAIPFAFDFALKMHIKEKSFKHSIN